MINPTKLHNELDLAGIPILGCSSNGRIDFKDEATQAQKDQASAILAKHDPTPTPLEAFLKTGRDKLVSKLLVRMSSHFNNMDPGEAKKIQEDIDKEANTIAEILGISLAEGRRP